MTAIAGERISWNWFRVGAWSGSFAVHALVVLLILIAMAQPIVPVVKRVQEPILMSLIEHEPPPPALPEPPPPTVQHRTKPTPVRVPPAVPVAPLTPMSIPAPPSPPVESRSSAVDPPPGPATPDIGAAAGSATQALAYATPVTPVYPPASKHALEQGTVVLRVLVDASGAPQRVEIAKSSGHTRLDMAARESVLRARFRPVMRDGAAVPAWGLVPIAFHLDRG
ncbi:MAG: energy transducer TonB [Rhodanobacteraceae bacterium]